MITSPVTTLVSGLAASMASILSLCAAPKRRFATKHARIMIHQPRIMGSIQGQATDLDIQAKEIIKTRALIVGVYVEKTGKDRKTIEKAKGIMMKKTRLSEPEAFKTMQKIARDQNLKLIEVARRILEAEGQR